MQNVDPKEQVKEAIINEASEVFSRFGYRKTTMVEIAQRVRKAKSSIFHYFDSKEDIFLAVLNKEGRELLRIFDDALQSEKTPQLKLRKYFLTKMEALPSIVNFYNALNDAELEHYDFIQRLRKLHLKMEREMIVEILQKGVDAGVFSLDNLPSLATSIATAFKGFEVVYKDVEVNQEVSPEVIEQMDLLLNLLLRGIETR